MCIAYNIFFCQPNKTIKIYTELSIFISITALLRKLRKKKDQYFLSLLLTYKGLDLPFLLDLFTSSTPMSSDTNTLKTTRSKLLHFHPFKMFFSIISSKEPWYHCSVKPLKPPLQTPVKWFLSPLLLLCPMFLSNLRSIISNLMCTTLKRA